MSANRSNGRTVNGHERPRLGISSCLVGERVRYDGESRRDSLFTETLADHVEWVPVCPEVECGLAVPREPMRLEGTRASARLVTVDTCVDHTDLLREWATLRLGELDSANLWGFVLKSRSPSCGVWDAPFYDEDGVARSEGAGLFARSVRTAFHLLPIEDDERLHDDGPLGSFIERVCCMRRYRDAVGERRSQEALAAFHEKHVLQLRTHSAGLERRMRGLVESAFHDDSGLLFDRYEGLLAGVLEAEVTTAGHAWVLRYTLELVREALADDERKEIADAIDRFAVGAAPLAAPVCLLRRQEQAIPLSPGQSYLEPHPVERALRYGA